MSHQSVQDFFQCHAMQRVFDILVRQNTTLVFNFSESSGMHCTILRRFFETNLDFVRMMQESPYTVPFFKKGVIRLGNKSNSKREVKKKKGSFKSKKK